MNGNKGSPNDETATTLDGLYHHEQSEDTPIELFEQFAAELEQEEIFTPVTGKQVRLPNGKLITLNIQQTEALELGITWLKDQTNLFYTLSGFSGTGKTSISLQLIKEAHNCNIISIVVAAPTHKAKKVISNATGLEGETIQSLLGLSPNVELADFDINKPEFAAKRKPSIEYYKMLILDEVSMLNKDLWEMLKVQARRFNVKILSLGDSLQLPPVKEDMSLVFTDPNITYKYELSQVERQKDGNPLLLMYDSIRKNITAEHDQFYREDKVEVISRPDHEGSNDPRNPQVEMGHRFLSNLNQFGKQVVEAFKSEDFQFDPNFCKVLCWTNYRVEFWNQSIRKTLVADLAKKPNISQEVLLHSNILIPHELLMGYATYTDGLQNSGEYKVIAMQYDEKKVWYGDKKQYSAEIRGYRVCLLDVDLDTTLNTFIIDPEDDNITTFTKVFNSYLFLAKTLKKWPAYFAFKGEHLLMKEIRDAHGQLVCKKDLDYAYAQSIHKCQGSTFDQVFVDLENVNLNKNVVERNKLKYVALSRPRYLATIFTGGVS
jgi:hypothetical protein